MSALPPKADIAERDWDVCFVPKADIGSTCQVSRPFEDTLFMGRHKLARYLPFRSFDRR
jgi:hypothetical protein